MNFRPVYQNLDTSFVNLAALIEHLQQRPAFAGFVRVRFRDFEAEIHLAQGNRLIVRGRDSFSGHISKDAGELQKVLIRSQEPGGAISVFQNLEAGIHNQFPENNIKNPAPEPPGKLEPPPGKFEIGKPKPAPFSARMAEIKSGKTVYKNPQEKTVRLSRPVPEKVEKPLNREKTVLPDFPFTTGSRPRSKTGQMKLTDEQFRSLAGHLAEIFGTVEKSLRAARLDFPAAVRFACTALSGDYPFLQPGQSAFRYSAGEIKIEKRINPNQLIAGLFEVLRIILKKLGRNPGYAAVYRATVQDLLALMRRRKPLWDEFSLASRVEKLIGA